MVLEKAARPEGASARSEISRRPGGPEFTA